MRDAQAVVLEVVSSIGNGRTGRYGATLKLLRTRGYRGPCGVSRALYLTGSARDSSAYAVILVRRIILCGRSSVLNLVAKIVGAPVRQKGPLLYRRLSVWRLDRLGAGKK
jgi:hypothetical protein